MSKKKNDSEFVQGVAYACAELMRAGEDSLAESILFATVRKVEELEAAKVDPYDLDPLRPLFETTEAEQP